MNIKKFNIVMAIIIVILIIAIIWKHSVSSTPSATSTTTTETGTETGILPPGVSIIPGTNVTITQPQPQKVNLPEPDLNRPIPNNPSLDAASEAALQTGLATAVTNLQKNSTSFTDWVNLGFYRKALGDYQGAAQAWEYVSLLYPQNTVAFGDLADLYENFLNEPAQAETDYQTAIKNNPNDIDAYADLAAMYESDQDKSAAISVLKQGASANPSDFSLILSLARYDKSIGNTTDANIAYAQAISIAQKQNNYGVASSIQAEESGNK